MTCKDCAHYEACEFNSFFYGGKHGEEKFKEYENSMLIEFACQNFKDKSRFVELPCTVGDRLYYANKTLNEVCEATVVRIDINYIEEPYIWLTLDYLTSRVGKCRHRGIADLMLNKTLFFTYEEAEKALERS